MAQARIGDTRTCKNCGEQFTRVHGKQIYCKAECRQPQHRKIITICSGCGATCTKHANDETRYRNTYCSQLCRSYHQWGPRYTQLPPDHWARWFGATSLWTPPATRARFFAGTCKDCDKTFIEYAYGVPSDYCSPRCQGRTHARRRRAREHKATGTFTYAQIMRQYARQGNVCAYCKTHNGLPEPEHVLPLSRGGRNDMANLVAACHQCNSDKGDQTLSEWAADRRRRNLPTLDTDLDTAPYRHLAAQEPTRPSTRQSSAENPQNLAA